jgi:hypothetical protein
MSDFGAPGKKSSMLPNLLVIGAQKCGTTSLHRYLDAHPEIAMSEPKELDFFVEHENRAPHLVDGNWHRGVDWYGSHFPDDVPVRGEASPNYTAYPNVPRVPERAAQVVPDARLIYLVRDPIDRIVSQYLHRVGASRERRPLDEVLADEDAAARYVDRSRYAMQVDRWLDHFPGERLLVLAQEDLRADAPSVLRRAFHFLSVDELFVSGEFTRAHQPSSEKRATAGVARRLERPLASAAHRLPLGASRALGRAFRGTFGRTLDRPTISDERRRELGSLLHDDVERLRALTGQRFDSWSL